MRWGFTIFVRGSRHVAVTLTVMILASSPPLSLSLWFLLFLVLFFSHSITIFCISLHISSFFFSTILLLLGFPSYAILLFFIFPNHPPPPPYPPPPPSSSWFLFLHLTLLFFSSTITNSFFFSLHIHYPSSASSSF